jgi:glycosyltransferase involved in cell wall biosynthesis
MRGLGSGVSVVVPAHNEAPTIASVVTQIQAALPEAEILVVDDGSQDGTSEKAAATGVRVMRLEQNGGKGKALQAGIKAATGDVLVFIDADGQDDPSEMPPMLAALTPDVDLVLGSRFVGTFNRGAITKFNLIGTQGINTISRLLFRSRITDPCAGFRAVRREAIECVGIKAAGYDIEVDVVFRILRAGGKVVEVPAVRSPRVAGRSGLSSIGDGLAILNRMIQIRLERNPPRLPARNGAAPARPAAILDAGLYPATELAESDRGPIGAA